MLRQCSKSIYRGEILFLAILLHGTIFASLRLHQAHAYSVSSGKIQVSAVNSMEDWCAVADVRYNEWIQGKGRTSRDAFRKATMELYRDERPNARLFLAKLRRTGEPDDVNNNDSNLNSHSQVVVGAAEMSPHEFENALLDHKKQVRYVTDVVTDRRYRRKGIATIIMQALEQDAISNGVDYLVLNVAPENVAAFEFYQRLGYHEHPPDGDLLSILNVEGLTENAGTHGQVLLSKCIST